MLNQDKQALVQAICERLETTPVFHTFYRSSFSGGLYIKDGRNNEYLLEIRCFGLGVNIEPYTYSVGPEITVWFWETEQVFRLVALIRKTLKQIKEQAAKEDIERKTQLFRELT